MSTRPSRLRASLATQVSDLLGAAIYKDEVVVNIPSRGYRLNPHMLLDISLLRAAEASDVTASAEDVTTFRS